MSGEELQAILQAALANHHAGKMAQAEQLYRRVLSVAPEHPVALHHLGVLALQHGNAETAVKLIRRSIEIEPTAGALNNLGEALRLLGRLPEAIDCYKRAIASDPRQVDAMSNMGLALTAQKQLPEAERILRQAIAMAPNHLAALVALATVLTSSAKHDEAVAIWERVVRLSPGNAGFHRSLAEGWMEAGDPYRALAALRRALELEPSDALTHANMASAFEKLNRLDEAVTAARKTVELAPNLWQPYYELGGILSRAGRQEEAIEPLRAGIKLNPRSADLFGGLGSVLMAMGRPDEAAEAFINGIAIDPSNTHLRCALSSARLSCRKFSSAVDAARAALKINAHDVESHAALAFALLAAGEYEEGFKEYEWRWRDASFTTKPRDFEQPLWDGSNPSGRRILIHSEQGFGDVFQFLRYVPMIRQMGATVLVETNYKVSGLVRRMAADFLVCTAGTMLPDFDMHVPMLSLPAIFGTTARRVPASVPYLAADRGLAEQWRSKLGSRDGLLVGLVWAGNAKPDPKRSATLASVAPLARIPGVSFILMQPPPESDEAKNPPEGMKLINLGPELRDFADTTASVLANLDLLITIDTGVAHLAGAMGIPTWVLLPMVTDWRWMLQESSTPWYPTVRLFRQNSRGDWAWVIERVAVELARLSERRRSDLHLAGPAAV
jgi:tetratricopeptide (TPR) repeat protein